MEKVNMDEVITHIVNAMYTQMQDDVADRLKMVLYMHLGNLALIRESTEISTKLDDNDATIRLFLDNLRLERKSDETIKNYGLEYRAFFTMINKNYRDVTTMDVRQYLAYCQLTRGNGPVTINNKIHFLGSLFKWLTVEEFISKNPMLKVKLIKTDKRIKEVLSDEDMERIRCACTNERDLAIIDMLYITGMRVGELIRINRSDVDFVRGRCVVYGKGRKERPVYITGKNNVHLRNYLDSRTDDNPALFVGLKKPYIRLSRDGVRAMCTKLGQITGIHVNPHKFRRTMATDMINRGAPAEHVQQILGHTSVQTTLDCYAAISAQVIEQSHKRFAGR